MAKLINQDMKLKAYAKKIVVKQNGKLVEVPSEVYKNGEWISIQNEFEDEIKLGETTITPTNEQQIILAKNSGLNGFKKVVVEKSNPSFNIAYGDTTPADTSKLWLNCQEPSGVEVGNYYTTVNQGENVLLKLYTSDTLHTIYTKGIFKYSDTQIGVVYHQSTSDNPLVYIINKDSGEIEETIMLSKVSYSLESACYKVGNILYVIGYSNSSSKLYGFNLIDDTIILKRSFDTYQNSHSYMFMMENDNDNLYVVSANSSGSMICYVKRYSISEDSVSNVGSYISGYSSYYGLGPKGGQCYYNNYLYCTYKNASYTFIKKYDLLNCVWEDINPIINYLEEKGYTYFYNKQTLAIDNFIYFFGGKIGTTDAYSNKVLRYNIATEEVQECSDMLGTKNTMYNGIVYDNTAYLFHNSSGSYYLSTFKHSQELEENKVVITTDTLYNNNVKLIVSDTINLSANIHNAYIGNADNLATKVNAYYYKITGQKPSGYSSLIFDKNTILKNYSTLIEMGKIDYEGMFPFKNSEGIVYVLAVLYLSRNDSLEIVIIDELGNMCFSVSINSNRDFNSTSTYGDCIWVEGDTYTFEFGEYLEFSNEVDGKILTHTMDDFTLMGTAIGGDGGVLGKWLGINTKDPFEWGSLQEQNVFLGETITLEAPLTNNFGWEMTYNVISDLEVSNNSNTLTINGGSALGTYPITITATSSEYNSVYEKKFNVITNNAITWSTIADQTCNVNTTLTLDLSTYYTNNSSYDVTLSASSSDNTNFEVSITGNTLTVNCLAVANTTITIEAIVLGITYSVSFNLTVTE